MKRVIFVLTLGFFLNACSGVNDSDTENSSSSIQSSTVGPSSSGESSNSQNSSSLSSSSGQSSTQKSSSSGQNGQSSSNLNSSSSSTSLSDQIIVEGTMTDARDAQEYRTLTLGSQTWMAQNLNWEAPTESWCYDGSPLYCELWGRLYSWDAMLQGESPSKTNPSQVKGVCPTGWHVPSRAEWDELAQTVVDYTGEGVFSEAEWSRVGYYLKANIGWSSVAGGGIDKFGFSAGAFGYRYYVSDIDIFKADRVHGYFWTASEKDSDNGFLTAFSSNTSGMDRTNAPKDAAVYVRCVKD